MTSVVLQEQANNSYASNKMDKSLLATTKSGGVPNEHNANNEVSDTSSLHNDSGAGGGAFKQRHQTPPNSIADSSCTGRTTPSSNSTSTGGIALIGGGCCTNCGVPCNLLNPSPHGKLCSSCHHHWRSVRQHSVETFNLFLTYNIFLTIDALATSDPPRVPTLVNVYEIVMLIGTRENHPAA